MRKLRNIALAVALVTAGTALAQKTAGGGIDNGMLRQIEQKATKNHPALSNAMASNSIEDLARNYRNATITDDHFSVETPKQNIHNQRQSGRCWMFSSFNVFRANFAKRHNDTRRVEYSHDYRFF